VEVPRGKVLGRYLLTSADAGTRATGECAMAGIARKRPSMRESEKQGSSFDLPYEGSKSRSGAQAPASNYDPVVRSSI
jgi:hypothetical protein